jgi:hypothetical protein
MNEVNGLAHQRVLSILWDLGKMNYEKFRFRRILLFVKPSIVCISPQTLQYMFSMFFHDVQSRSVEEEDAMCDVKRGLSPDL